MVKSKASSVQPSQAAHQASHWSLVGSFHHATDNRRHQRLSTWRYLPGSQGSYRLEYFQWKRPPTASLRSIPRGFRQDRLGSFAAKLHRLLVGRNEPPLASATVARHSDVDTPRGQY
jgi:hypothetical protein